MIKFQDFFGVQNPEMTKVKFNMNEGNIDIPAWDLLRDDDPSKQQRWINMNAHYEKKNANNNYGRAKYVLAFAQYYPFGKEYYIFGGMYEISPKNPLINGGVGYNLVKCEQFNRYEHRVIIKFPKPVGQSYNLWYNTVIQKGGEIYELLPQKAIEDFPGFNNICLKHKDLQYIFKNEAPEWKRQLSAVKGVYCITDNKTGQLYIGSAYGDYAGLWQRWQQYANVKNLTGGNKHFEKFENKTYIMENFTYSILEILDPRTIDDDVIARENFWKGVFQSKKFGMNNN